jgi:hypothetical protein
VQARDGVVHGHVDLFEHRGEHVPGASPRWSVSTPIARRPDSRAAWKTPRPVSPEAWKMTSPAAYWRAARVWPSAGLLKAAGVAPA